MSTWFAPAGREDPERLAEMSRSVRESPLFQAILDSIDGFLMVLNPQRQVLAVNRNLLDHFRLEEPACLAGSRPGEILGCIHAAIGPDGCGTSKACRTCGAAISILSSQEQDQPITGECLATVQGSEGNDSLEFRVRSTPIRVGGHDFTVLVFNDISGEKRRDALERTFYHDVMNVIGGLMGWSGMFSKLDELDQKEAAGRIANLARRLKREVEDQRRLSLAESGSLTVEMVAVPARDMLETIRSVFEAHQASQGRTLEIAQVDPDALVVTDPGLLERVLVNMTKNALEAAHEGETVRVSFERLGGAPVFSVHNPGVIPEEIALQIFKRSFSTKGQSGRGIGTYSMKLFGERYLKGKVGFETSMEQGTTFYLRLPLPETLTESADRRNSPPGAGRQPGDRAS